MSTLIASRLTTRISSSVIRGPVASPTAIRVIVNSEQRGERGARDIGAAVAQAEDALRLARCDLLVALGWLADNLGLAKGSPRSEEIDARWTFGGRWDPEETLPLVLPGAAIPRPRQNARVKPASASLRWLAARGAMAYEVHLGETKDPPRVAQVASAAFEPGPLGRHDVSLADRHHHADRDPGGRAVVDVHHVAPSRESARKAPGSPPGPTTVDGSL